MSKSATLFANRYAVIEKVGTGGMADVYRAEDTKTGRMVAIKVLKKELANDADFVRRFKTEGQAAASLDNANIVSVYDVGNLGSIYYIIMEFVDGITLKEYIRRKGVLSPRETMAITAQVAVGLRAAHAHHIVHRDIKPQNIILSKEGKVKVTDFGIAHSLTSQTMTVDGSAMGSVHYIAPEQAKGMSCDERSDIYSLGIVMYEMITGRVPFDKDTSVAVALAHMNETMVPPSDINPACPKALEQIIFRCTQKARDRRYRNCTELLADLKVAVASPDFNFEKQEQENLMKSDTLVFSPEEVENIRKTGLPAEAPAAAQTTIDEYEEDAAAAGTRFVPNESEYDDVVDGEGTENHVDTLFGEDEEEDEKSVFDRILVVISVVLGVVILCLTIYLIASLSGCVQTSQTNGTKKTTAAPYQSTTESDTQPEDNITLETIAADDYDPETQTIVPNVIGMSIKAAMQLLKDKNLDYKISTKVVYSDQYKIGMICEQSYPEGTIVMKGSTIVITLSAGTDKFEIKPTYVGGLLSVFKNDVSKFSDMFTVEYEGVYSESVGINRIISIDPAEGIVAAGTTIHVVYSMGAEYVVVPDLYGYSKGEAASRLADYGLIMGGISESYSDTVEKGKVMGQQYPAGTTLHNGASVDLVVSAGVDPNANTMPELLGYTEEDARTILQGFNIGLNIVIAEGESEDYNNGVVIAQDPPANTSLSQGMTITLTINTGGKKAPFELKNYVGSGIEEALSELEPEGIVCTVTYVPTDDPNENMIIQSQTPSGGNMVSEGDEVKFTVAEYDPSAEKVEVRDFTQDTYENAQNWCSENGLTATVSYEDTSDVNLNNIVKSQNPASGQVDKGSSISFVVYKYVEAPTDPTPAEIEIPSYIGRVFSEVKTILEGQGFVVTYTTTTTGATAENNGCIVSQNPAGTKVKEGSTITFTVYEYIAPTSGPVGNYLGMTAAEARSAIEAAQFVYAEGAVVNTEDASMDGRVAAQSAANGSTLAYGSTITVSLYHYVEPTAAPVTVGTYTGKLLADANAEASAAGLTPDGAPEYTDTGDASLEGIVAGQSLAANSAVDRGTTIHFIVYRYVAPTEPVTEPPIETDPPVTEEPAP